MNESHKTVVLLSQYLDLLVKKPSREQAIIVRDWLKANEKTLLDNLHAQLDHIIASPEVKRIDPIADLKPGETRVIPSSSPDFNVILNTCCLGRVGTIPYTFIKEADGTTTLYLLLGTKHPFPDEPHIQRRTDIGGGCKMGKGETIMGCGMREFKEETRGAVPVPEQKDITIILIGERGRGRAYAYLMYNYKGIREFPFVPNKELSYIAWYTMKEFYRPWPAGLLNDQSLNIFKAHVGKHILLSLPQ